MTERAPYLARDIGALERRHHRLTLLGLGILVAFAVGPLLSEPLGALTASRLARFQHVGEFCLAALHALLTPVRGGFHLVLAVGVLYALFDRVRAARQHRRVMASLRSKTLAPESALADAARAVGLAPTRVVLVDGLPTPALTVGWLAPRVLLSMRVLALLGPEQIERVLAHEAAHVRRRDPARLFLMRFVAQALFWLPMFRHLADDLAEEMEIIADDEAASAPSDGVASDVDPAGALVLADAIVTLARAFAPAPTTQLSGAGVLAHPSPDLLERRVRRLLGERVIARSHVRRTHVATAMVALGVFWLGLFPSLHPVSHAGAAVAIHCEHEGLSPFAHLVCRCDDEAMAHAGSSDAHCEGMH